MRLAVAVSFLLAACTGNDAKPTPDAGSSPRPRFIGRWDLSDPAGPRANWSGSAVEATFHGTAATVDLAVTSTSGYYLVSVVDGGPPSRFQAVQGRSTYALASGLTDGQHTVWLAIDTEAH